MSLTLLSLCQEAIAGIGGIHTPSSIFNNTDDDDAVILKWAAFQTGRELVRKYSWQLLMTPTTFTTSNGTYQYSLPSDFQRFANDTFYNVTESRQLWGPHLPAPWAELTRGITVGTANYNFRVRGGYIELSPTPTATQTIGYDYYSNAYCSSSGGTAQSAWAADTDLARLADDIFVLGVRYRFMQRKELPFAEDKAAYMEALTDAVYDDTPKAVANMTGLPRRNYSNLPDTNFGL